jgi:hypothetical protein
MKTILPVWDWTRRQRVAQHYGVDPYNTVDSTVGVLHAIVRDRIMANWGHAQKCRLYSVFENVADMLAKRP